jgi:thioredoxin-like negative regulator of GroEL/YHS domain-containing protein
MSSWSGWVVIRHLMFSACTAIAVVSSAEAQQAISWQANIPAAQQIAGQTNRLVLVHFWAPWCKPCMKLEAEVFSKPETIQTLNTHFVPVKINVDEASNLARQYNVTSLPTDVVLSPSGQLVAQLHCPLNVNQYLQQINQVAGGYRKLNDQLAAGANRATQTAQNYRTEAQNALASVAPAAGATVPYSPPATAATAPTSPAATAPVAGNPATRASTPTVTQGAAVPAYSNDRYADYVRISQAEVAANPPAAQPPAGPPFAGQSPQGPPSTAQVPAASGPSIDPGISTKNPPQTSAPGATAPAVAAAPAIQLPPGSPPLGIDGYCCVQLKEQKRWTMGDRRWGAVHRGRTYLFTGAEEQKRFLANPDFYSPVIAGNDPVLALDQGQSVAGRREHGVFYENRIYLFADEASLQRFYQNPNRYAAEVVQAMR